MARINGALNSTFKMSFDSSLFYTYKSQYLINVRLIGKEDCNLVGNSKDNILIGNFGSNIIDGKKGYDIVQFEGKKSDYKIEIRKGKVIICDLINKNNCDTLINIEVLRFSDCDFCL